MPASIGKVHVDVVPDASQAVAIIVAATRLHDALFYAGREAIDALPEHARRAYADLQSALTWTPPRSRTALLASIAAEERRQDRRV